MIRCGRKEDLEDLSKALWAKGLTYDLKSATVHTALEY